MWSGNQYEKSVAVDRRKRRIGHRRLRGPLEPGQARPPPASRPPARGDGAVQAGQAPPTGLWSRLRVQPSAHPRSRVWRRCRWRRPGTGGLPGRSGRERENPRSPGTGALHGAGATWTGGASSRRLPVAEASLRLGRTFHGGWIRVLDPARSVSSNGHRATRVGDGREEAIHVPTPTSRRRRPRRPVGAHLRLFLTRNLYRGINVV